MQRSTDIGYTEHIVFIIIMLVIVIIFINKPIFVIFVH